MNNIFCIFNNTLKEHSTLRIHYIFVSGLFIVPLDLKGELKGIGSLESVSSPTEEADG